MSKPIKTTVTQGYYQGAKHIHDFIKKEISKKKNAQDYQIWYDQYQTYGSVLRHNAGTDGEEKVTRENLSRVINACHHSMHHNPLEHNDLKWDADKMSIDAVKKFSDIILENDDKKLKYYMNCITGRDITNKITYKKLLSLPVPPTRKPDYTDLEDLKEKVSDLLYDLKTADSKWHKDSSEFKKMKKALKHLWEGIISEEPLDDKEMGARIEELQYASMEYVLAKGVGTQSTTMGKDRMKCALQIITYTADKMDCYASEERLKEIADFEKENFGMIISRDTVDDYSKDAEYSEDEIEYDNEGLNDELFV